MQGIFISYRRDDAEGHAGRLFEDLADRFGKASVFMDVTGIEPGRDFRKVIEQQVASCGVLLAVIGRSWLAATDVEGRRRLDDPRDFVRLETATALKRDIPVIPVLVHGARMPSADQLPEALADLAFRNSVELTHARWSSDVQLLITALLPYVDAAALPASAQGDAGRAAPGPPTDPLPAAAALGAPAGVGGPTGPSVAKAWPRTAVGAAGAIVAAGVGYYAWQRGEPSDPQGPEVTRTTAAASADAATSLRAASTMQPSIGAASAPPSATAASAPPSVTATTAPPSTSAATPSASGVLPASAAPRTASASKVEGKVLAAAGARKSPGAITAESDAKPAPAPRAEARKPVPADRASLAAADRLTSQSLGVPGAARYAPARAPDAASGRPPAQDAPADAREEESASPAARAEPGRANAGTALLGGAASASMASRTIAILPETRYVNVTGGEIVRFTVGDRSFAWNFNGRPSSFDLGLVAPPGTLHHKVTAYVAPNPLYPRPGR